MVTCIVMAEEEFTLYKNKPKEKYNKLNKPNIFIGCNIKSEYDERRITIKNNLKPTRIYHNDRYFYGCVFEPNEIFLRIIDDLSKFESIDLYTYNKILKENNFSCDENFAYFNDGTYPIDSTHIPNYIQNFNYQMFFDDKPEIPMHQRIKAINMFILK